MSAHNLCIREQR